MLVVGDSPQRLESAQVLKVNFAIVELWTTSLLQPLAGIEVAQVGIAAQFGNQIKMASANPVSVLTFGKKAVGSEVFDLRRQQVAMSLELAEIKIDAGMFFISLCQLSAWRGLLDGKRVSAVSRHIDDGEIGRFISPLLGPALTVEEVVETVSLFPALGDERAILSRNQGGGGKKDGRHGLMIQQRPIKRLAKLKGEG